MLSRDQVLHVARLARLELTHEEVERFGGELSKVLDHIELIAELGDLADVPPTSHVIDVENALRADEPRPSLPRREGARERARRGRRRLPRAVPGSRMRQTDPEWPARMRADRSAQAAAAIKDGDLDAAEYFEFYRQRAADDAFNSYIWVAEETPRVQPGQRRSPASRSRSRTSSAPRASRARPARRSSRATARRTRRRACATSRRPAARCWARPTRTSSRWAPRPRTPPTARR